MPEIAVRVATAHDAEAIAALHVSSWRDHYRGAYSDDFLDGEALDDRRATWSGRLAEPDPSRFTFVAEIDAALAGFVYTILDEDASLGAVVQNLHVATPLQRNGIGSRLLSEVARAVADRRSDSGLHVWARERNESAAAFYAALGGIPVQTKLGGPFADGSFAPVLCFAWPNPSALVDGRLTGRTATA